MEPTPTPVFPPLSRWCKTQPYLTNVENRKRKRSKGSFEVRPSMNGLGMFASKSISSGDLIVANEDPIVQCQAARHTHPNFCHRCAAPIGSFRGSHLRAPKDLVLPYLDNEDQGLVFTSSVISCQGCQEVGWCSDECYENERLQHAIECELSSLTDFYDTQENPIIFRLATQSITLILSQMASLSPLERIPIHKFFFWGDFGSHPLWWEVGTSSDEKKKQASIDESSIVQICSLVNIGSILGMLQCNVMEYEYPSPIQQYMEHVEVIFQPEAGDDHQSESSKESAINNVDDSLKDGCNWLIKNKMTSGECDTAVVGSGLYPLLTLANHDCNPNASIEFLQESNRGSMVATRDISAGEEICITYIPNGGAGCGDGCQYFSHFEPTRTWKWLNGNDDDDESDASSTTEQNTGEEEDCNGDDQLLASIGYGVEREEEEKEEKEEMLEEVEQPLEGSNYTERAKGLLEYGFKCECRRCINEQTREA
ncbi:hypothetical protein ACHAW5_001613 [Stephanodiscus triporus]|uniref:SET domain-containing protein n=1 Tax=Stephanodiscus triporus TaxID=2934178 RepID=A0ABD3PZI3_9STRA